MPGQFFQTIIRELSKLKFIGAIVLVGLVGYFFYEKSMKSNPFREVEWIEDTPGATERYVTFTPILRSNRKPIGPTVGADYAGLTFEDLDGDGAKEAIIETRRSLHLEFYSPERHVLRFRNDDTTGPKFEYVDEPEVKDK